MNNDSIKKIIVPIDAYEQRIDVVLAQLLPDFSRTQLTSWLKAGRITVDKKLLKPKEKVYGGEVIEIALQTLAQDTPDLSNQPQAMDLDIVYEDSSLVVVNKPAGLVVHPGAGNPDATLMNALLHHAPQLNQLPRAGIVHRLDKDTTGLMVVAKTLTSLTFLSKEMQERLIDRHYIALVHSNIVGGNTIDTYYGRHPRNRIKMAVTHSGKQAITQYRVRKRYTKYTLLDLKLMTGRTHQIRVHMAHIKHPVVGDTLYGQRAHIPPSAFPELLHALQQFKRQALHAAKLSLTHPDSQERLTFEAPLPDDFNSLLILLDDYAATVSG